MPSRTPLGKLTEEFRRLFAKSPFFVNASFLLMIAILYLYCMPHNVQGGDTGEMAANPYAGRLLHPPGFPVFYWLARFATHVVPFESVYARAGMLSLLASLVSLSLLLSWRKLGPSFVIVLVLAGNKTFWHYSMVPEVFLLQAL